MIVIVALRTKLSLGSKMLVFNLLETAPPKPRETTTYCASAISLSMLSRAFPRGDHGDGAVGDARVVEDSRGGPAAGRPADPRRARGPCLQGTAVLHCLIILGSSSPYSKASHVFHVSGSGSLLAHMR